MKPNPLDPPKPLSEMTYSELMAWRVELARLRRIHGDPRDRLDWLDSIATQDLDWGSDQVPRDLRLREAPMMILKTLAKIVLTILGMILAAIVLNWWVGVAEGDVDLSLSQSRLSHSQWDVHRG
jgi:hypothetical protein